MRIFIAISPYLFGQQSNIMFLYDFNVLQVYQEKNDKYIFNRVDLQDFASRIEGNLRLYAGEFGETQFEIEFRYKSTFSEPQNSSTEIRQMFTEIPITDFSFLTVGKKRKNFGEAYFHSFSNRLSPTEIFLDRSERVIPAFVEYAWIATPILTFESIAWFNQAKNWRDVNLSQGVEITLDRFYGDIHLYYEEQKRWLAGLNLAYTLNAVGLYSEAIIKENSDQFNITENGLYPREGTYYSVSLGSSWQWETYSMRLEYAYRSEGYSDDEKELFKQYVAETKAIHYYNLNYYDRQYVGASLSISQVLLPNMSLSLSNILASDFRSGYLSGGIGYYFKDMVSVSLSGWYNYGENNSEYLLYSPMKYSVYSYLAVSF